MSNAKKVSSPYKKSGGAHCSVFGCTNNNAKLYKWKKTLCEIHDGEMHTDCPCLVPFSMHKFPANEDRRREWISCINRKGLTMDSKGYVSY